MPSAGISTVATVANNLAGAQIRAQNSFERPRHFVFDGVIGRRRLGKARAITENVLDLMDGADRLAHQDQVYSGVHAEFRRMATPSLSPRRPAP